MMRWLVCVLMMVLGAQGAYMQEHRWERGETFLTFLEKHQLPLSIYYNLDREDQELAAEIVSGVRYQLLLDDNEVIEQVLIPIGEELQLHIVKDKSTGAYELRTTPVSYQEESLKVTLEITLSPYQDIINATNSYALANEFVNSFKNSVNFRRLVKGDRLVIFYSQRTRLGQRYGNPKIEAAMVEVRGKEHFVFLYDDNRYYDAAGKEIEGFLLTVPVRYTRISSSFSYKRWHPILKRYRAHLGVDYAAPTGTPIVAAGEGRVTFVGTKGGYGKTVEIDHGHGYKTLYAHMNGYRKGIRRGSVVSKGQLIGYVGSTGISTGPHLHFGLYKDNRAINPNSVVKIEKDKLQGEKRKAFLAHVETFKPRFELALAEPSIPPREEPFEYMVQLETPIIMDAETVAVAN
ncbi:peptidoglycan DD-metalloendopeptidase family protein [Sulfurospirillum sp. T05]|uniref:Peptidoglycan DD-metalloendopeptidase family protein n=1 Tax=Sulfurospirillum tamanense TaxID=2813362 RepID=A0ABS2WQI8_9BACT|nr:peptidoglycan DD-metalloendopeptidase family protein [Sulfurospirillum tamanensis]MBN2963868.1 peptidoglycan DD-metalloendopeptidase family protein [Sulfurospirillum tamanensis]